MQRIIFVPQYPTKLRYQEWWYTELPKQFKKHGFDVYVLGEDYVTESKLTTGSCDMFSPISQAIEFETYQINEYMNMELRKDDILFWSDLSFPGLFGHVLMHKRPSKMYAFCHATSLNNLDYFESVRACKFPIETSLAYMFDKVFIGSKYHQEKLGWTNTMVTYLPFQPRDAVIGGVEKIFDIMSASRKSPQKVDIVLEELVEAHFSKISRPISQSWLNYFWNLNRAKILLITAYEDTFGYQIADAVTNHCIPIARRSLAYPELLPDRYLYSTPGELMTKIDSILNEREKWEIPKLLCEEGMNNFYDVICNVMKG